MIETARLHALESGLDIDYRVESAERCSRAHAGKFDVRDLHGDARARARPRRHRGGARQRSVRPGGDVFISTINRNLKSFALAIVGAEYIANLVPRGTHEYERLLKPSEVARFARAAALDVVDIAGLQLRPGARAVLAHQRPLGQLPHAPEATGRERAMTRPSAACCSISTARCSIPRSTCAKR